MKIIPTLLTTGTDEFSHQMQLFQKYFNRIQLDIADGILVPNHTTTIKDMIELISEKKVMVHENVVFDFHLMVKNFEKELLNIKKLQSLGMKVNLALVNAGLQPEITAIQKTCTFTIGLDIFPHVQIGDITRQFDLSQLSSIQVMTVNPGFQGSPFLEDMLNKIQQLREHGYRNEIMIDGGVNEKTIPVISGKKYPPDFLCIGSYLTKAGSSFSNRIQQLKNE